MKKADAKAGSIYRKKYGLPMLLLSTDVVTRKRGSGSGYEAAAAGTKVRRASDGGWGYHQADHGYLFVTGPQEELEKIDAKAALAFLLAGDKDPALWGDAKGCRVEMVFSLTQILGEAGAITEQERRERELAGERNRRKTAEYNEAATALNQLLDTKLSLRPSTYTWGTHLPKIELSLTQALEIAATARRLEGEALGRGMDSVLESVAARMDAGEIVEVPREYEDGE